MIQTIDWKREFDAPSPKLRGFIFISKVFQRRWVLAKGRLRKTVSIAL
jgi:hypothetical protein